MLYLLKKSMFGEGLLSAQLNKATKYYQHVEVLRISNRFKERVDYVGEIGAQRYFGCLLNFDSSKQYIIDPYNGAAGGGLTDIPELPYPVGLFRCMVGSGKSVIPDTFFDLTFSMSVIEHIGQAAVRFDRRPTDNPPPEQEEPRNAFCRDLFRITKPGGLTIHSIDHATRNRSFYRNFLDAGFEPIDDVELPSVEECMYDPDNIKQMTKWGKRRDQPSDETDWPLDSVIIMGFRRPNSRKASL